MAYKNLRSLVVSVLPDEKTHVGQLDFHVRNPHDLVHMSEFVNPEKRTYTFDGVEMKNGELTIRLKPQW